MWLRNVWHTSCFRKKSEDFNDSAWCHRRGKTGPHVEVKQFRRWPAPDLWPFVSHMSAAGKKQRRHSECDKHGVAAEGERRSDWHNPFTSFCTNLLVSFLKSIHVRWGQPCINSLPGFLMSWPRTMTRPGARVTSRLGSKQARPVLVCTTSVLWHQCCWWSHRRRKARLLHSFSNFLAVYPE